MFPQNKHFLVLGQNLDLNLTLPPMYQGVIRTIILDMGGFEHFLFYDGPQCLIWYSYFLYNERNDRTTQSSTLPAIKYFADIFGLSFNTKRLVFETMLIYNFWIPNICISSILINDQPSHSKFNFKIGQCHRPSMICEGRNCQNVRYRDACEFSVFLKMFPILTKIR